MKILIVDDCKTKRMIVKRTLRLAGFGDHDVVEAENGVQALAAIKEDFPDLILCDWNMPEMNGLALLQNLNTEGIEVNFGFVTSEGTPEMRDIASENGAMFLISKPFNVNVFKENFASVLS